MGIIVSKNFTDLTFSDFDSSLTTGMTGSLVAKLGNSGVSGFGLQGERTGNPASLYGTLTGSYTSDNIRFRYYFNDGSITTVSGDNISYFSLVGLSGSSGRVSVYHLYEAAQTSLTLRIRPDTGGDVIINGGGR